MRGARIAWLAYAALAGVMAALAIAMWSRALLLDGPILYGEGAVAHAAILTRSLAPYADLSGPSFTAANYPPLYFLVAAVGDPFLAGRLASIVATLAVAILIAWRARGAGALVPGALAVGWLALAPVAIWGPAVKPDLVALALTVGGVLALERRRAGLAAALVVAAVFAKPTAGFVLLALLGWIAWRERSLLVPFARGGLIAVAVAAIALVPFGYAGVWRHVVLWNALPWSLEPALLLVFLGIVIYAALLGTGVLARAFSPGPIAAYALAALPIVLAGGREGATINYLLDLGAAGSLALASVAPRLRLAPLYPLVAVANLVLAALVLDPLGVVPGRAATTGAWGDPSRIASAAAELGGDEVLLAEDSGLLIATGHRVVVDDLFLWSRLVAAGTIDPGPVVTDVQGARFTAIVSETDLAQLATAPAYERARWDPSLVRAVTERYRLAGRPEGGLFIYRPR